MTERQQSTTTKQENNTIKKSILIWLSIIPLAILNGGLREAVLTPRLEESCAQIVSGLILLLLIFLVTLIFIPRIGKGEQKTYWKIGLLWILLTLVFETVLGVAMGDSFGNLLRAYDITTGNLWLIIVVFTGVVPWLTAKVRRII
jgi:hypothetical protein